MNEEEVNYDERSFGMPRELNAKTKVWGGISLTNFVIVGFVPIIVAAFTGRGIVFPKQQILQYLLFVVLTFVLCLFLVLPVPGGQPHWRAFWLLVSRRKHKYYSIDSVNTKPIKRGCNGK